MDKLTADLVAQLLQMTQKNPDGNQGVWNPMLGILQQPAGGPMWYGEGDLSNYNVNSDGMIGKFGDGYVNSYDPEGNFLERSKQKSGAVLSPDLLKGAAAAAAMYAGASGLEGLMGGGVSSGLGAGELTAEQLAAEGILGGSYAPPVVGSGLGGLEGAITGMGGSPFSLGMEGGALSMPSFGSVLPAAGGLAGASALTGASGGGGSFLDKLGSNASDFFSKPANLLSTVGTLGALYENSKDADPLNTATTETRTTTKSLDPRFSDALFGTGGGTGLMGRAADYFAKNPTGQNETMRQAQEGMRGLLTNPDVLSSLYKAGAAGSGLLTGGANAGAKPWWWRG